VKIACTRAVCLHGGAIACELWIGCKCVLRVQVGPFAAPDVVHWAPGLPKTRSGKIMRRILRKVASGEMDQLGDTSTLADPSIVDTLIELKPENGNLK
jgi:acetyl-CoA synthetase